MEMQDVQLNLMEYGNLENTEVGEAAFWLANLWGNKSQLSPEFVKALEKEMKHHLAHFMENTKIVTKERVEKFKYKELDELNAAIRAQLKALARSQITIDKALNQAREEFTDDKSFDKWKSETFGEDIFFLLDD